MNINNSAGRVTRFCGQNQRFFASKTIHVHEEKATINIMPISSSCSIVLKSKRPLESRSLRLQDEQTILFVRSHYQSFRFHSRWEVIYNHVGITKQDIFTGLYGKLIKCKSLIRYEIVSQCFGLNSWRDDKIIAFACELDKIKASTFYNESVRIVKLTFSKAIYKSMEFKR